MVDITQTQKRICFNLMMCYLEKHGSTVQRLSYRDWSQVKGQEDLLTGGGCGGGRTEGLLAMGDKLERKGIHQGCVLSPCLFNCMQSTSWEMPGWMKHKLEFRLPGEISITSDVEMTPPYGRKWKGNKEPLHKSERGEWKSWPKINIQKTKIMAPSPITSWQIDEETMDTVIVYFLGLQNHCRWWLQPWN